MSLVEVLITVTVIGIIATVAIPAYTGYFDGSRETTARNMVETLNTAVHRFAESNYELVLTAVPTDTTDELAIVRTLQYQRPLYPPPGSPYLKPNWNPTQSSSTSDYRIQWSGRLFTLIKPGTQGVGLKVMQDGSDFTTRYQFPANYTPVGG